MPLPDEVQRRQLVGRKYKKSEALGKICLQSKKEARAEGQHSPDRADATVLAFAGRTIHDYLRGGVLVGSSSRRSAGAIIEGYSQETAKNTSQPQYKIIDGKFSDPYANYEAQLQQSTQRGRAYGSLSRLLNN